MADITRCKRQISERRRQQNRQAQKKYRERQKQHIQTLEGLVESREIFSSGRNPATLPDELPSYGVVSRRDRASLTSGFPGTDTAGGSSSEYSVRQNSDSSSSTISDTWMSVTTLEKQSSIPQVLNHLLRDDNHCNEDTRRRILSGEITVQDILRAGLEALSKPGAAQQPRNPFLLNSANDSIQRQRPVLRTDKILVLENRTLEYARSLPDIYRNNLQIKEVTMVAALRANAEAIGVSFQRLTDPESESPFYSGSLDDTLHDSHHTLAEIHNIYQHLRPTPAQLKHNHHPYIDVLPFPTLRQRLIELLSTNPPMIDEDEICEDFVQGALICWGSGHENQATGSGVPWDYRSWEAQPWFLRKWWILVGGYEGELFQQSKWWNEMRGGRLRCSW